MIVLDDGGKADSMVQCPDVRRNRQHELCNQLLQSHSAQGARVHVSICSSAQHTAICRGKRILSVDMLCEHEDKQPIRIPDVRSGVWSDWLHHSASAEGWKHFARCQVHGTLLHHQFRIYCAANGGVVGHELCKRTLQEVNVEKHVRGMKD